MRKLNLLKSSVIALSLGLFVTSCGSDNTDILQTPGGGDLDPTIATIDLTKGGSPDDKFNATATGVAGGTTLGRVKFTSDVNMNRLYVTRTLPGGEPQPFVFTLDKQTVRKLTKSDGSIDLNGDEKKSFDFTFDLEVPDNMDGDIIYNFWATSGRGDFEIPSKKLLVGVGTIDVKVGTGSTAKKLIKFDGIELRAALGSGASSTFASFFDLTRTYKINEGADFSAFWDFGYFYDGSTSEASVYSTSGYPMSQVDIVTISNAEKGADEEAITAADLKKTYFKKNTTINFETATIADIEGLTVSDLDPQKIVGLANGDVLEFLSASGRKGLIKVASITPGAGVVGKIILNVIQLPAAPIMDGSQM